MSNLVERLRSGDEIHDDNWSMLDEAAELIESQAAQIEQLRTLCDQLAGQLTVAIAYVPIGGYGYDDCDSALSEWRQWKGGV